MTITATAGTCTAVQSSRIGYTNGCRCLGCSAAHRAYNQQRRRRIAYGTWKHRTDADTVRSHLKTLSAAGIGLRRVADLSGVPLNTLYAVRYREQVWHDTATAVLAVTVENATLADGALVDATGTVRRIQALTAIGWSITAQAQRMRRGARAHAHLLYATQVTAGIARLVARQYEQLSGTAAPVGQYSLRTRRWAMGQGWPPPLAWEDVDIDDPDAVPNLGADTDDFVDEVLVERVAAGLAPFKALNDAERAVLFQGPASGWTDSQAARLLRMSVVTVDRWRARAAGAEHVAA